MNREFLTDTAERVVRTFAQALLAYFAAGAVNVVSADWGEALTVGATAALIALLTCVVARLKGDSATASFVDAPGKHAAPEA